MEASLELRGSGRPKASNRREFLARTGMGFGLLGLAGVLDRAGLLAPRVEAGPRTGALAPKPGHHPARAQSVIWLFMNGGPSAIDLFDPKPELKKHHGQKLTGKGEIDAFFGKPGPLMRPAFPGENYGKCGAWVCNQLPELARHVDDIAFIRSCVAESNNHAPALLQMNTGMTRLGFPSAGSWLTYGLGSENGDLPGYVVMYDWRGIPVGGPALWSSGFLPSNFQGTRFRPAGSPVLNLTRPDDQTPGSQRAQLDLLAELNDEHRSRHPLEPDLMARIESFELAYRMQSAAPELVDLKRESADTRRLYGLDNPGAERFGSQLLMARRMAERGVRFIQIYNGGPGGDWDSHSDVMGDHATRCRETDLPIAGLLTDLKQRGMLDSTLVVWGGEFGRLPVSQNGRGRDHNPHGFLTWMAGGGVKGGVSHGETDELGFRAARDPVTVHDLHATLLHLAGLDHTRLTYEHNGRQFRLTDTAGSVIEPILA